jgi:hypothetical protein
VPELEVQVGAGAPAGAARSCDALAGLDLLTGVDAPAGEVGVQGPVALAEIDHDDVAVALVAGLLADRDHPAGLRGSDRERAQDADVDPRVRAAAV